MAVDYEKLLQDALRGVVRKILKEVAEKGREDPNHFYITLQTTYPGVQLPDFVKEENPEEVTLVLEHQFWDLSVEKDAFTVMLSFQDTPHKVRVPFCALLSFMDPSVRFGLQFTPPSLEDLELTPSDIQEVATDQSGKVVSLDAFRRK